MLAKEIQARNILSRSKVYKYTINPYVGCQHACTYCYARFMKRFTGHREPWGQFVDVKINAPDLLRKEIKRKPVGTVWISGVCDPYQPIERNYQLTRKCLEILIQHNWPITIQTRSTLILRDLELLKQSSLIEVGITVTTGDDNIRRLFEPYATPIRERIRTLKELHSSKIRTFVMIAPMLPKAEELVNSLSGRVDYILIDKMNYHYADWVYRKYGLQNTSIPDSGHELCSSFIKLGIDCQVLF